MDYSNLEFFGYNADQKKLLELLRIAKKPKSKIKLVLMTAPSFVVDFNYKDFVPKIKGLGFDKVTELTFGAKIINQQYHKYIKAHYSSYQNCKKIKDADFQNKFISSVCPASVELVKKQFPELAKFLLPFDSPMSAMAKIMKKNFPKHSIVFLSPCSAKKHEALSISKGSKIKSKKLIDAVITFAELKQIIAKEKPKSKKGAIKFDSFYADYTKIYPLSGGLASTLHYKGILKKREVVSSDGVTNLQKLFNSNPSKVFYDILFCKGGCIGGPGIASGAPIIIKKQRVLGYRNLSKKGKINADNGNEKYVKGIDFSTQFD
ncbi:MAG: [Fe-Fe] hydrogenase large subunit C-terminal domain-containing protein [archaeon]